MMRGAPDLVRRNFMASRVLRISGSLPAAARRRGLRSWRVEHAEYLQ